MTSHHRLLACSIALLCLSGCVHQGESAGDEALASRRYKDARTAYDGALDDRAVYAYEKRRIAAKRAEANDAQLEQELASVHATDARVAVAELVKIRNAASSDSPSVALVEKAQTAVDEAITRAMPALDELARAHRYGAALPFAAELATASRAGSPMRARYDALRGEAASYHAARAAASTTTGVRLLHARLAQSFGAPAPAPEWIAAVEAPLAVSWSVDVSGVTCSDAADKIKRAFPASDRGAPGTMRVEMRCSSKQRTFDTTEHYTYSTQEQYTDYVEKEHIVTTSTKGASKTECAPVMRTKYASGSSSPQNVYETECHKVDGASSFQSHVETERVPVTKTRQVDHDATRDVHHLEIATETTGRATVTVESSTASRDLAGTATAETVAYASPHGTRALDSSFGPSVSEAKATDAVISRLRALAGEAQEKRAAPWLENADAAAKDGRNDDAEGAYISTVLTIGRVPPSFASYLEKTYGIPPSDAPKALAGSSETTVGPPAPIAASPERVFEDASETGQRGGGGGGEVAFAFGRLESHDLGAQVSREILGAYVHGSKAVLSSGQTWGFGVYDRFEMQGFIGARSSDGFRNAAGDEEKNWGFALAAAYRALLGYRASRLGLFAGAEARVLAQGLGDVVQTGFLWPIVARAEWRVAGEGVVSLTGWASPLTSGPRTMGGELVVPFGRSPLGLQLTVERRYLHTELPLAAGGDDGATEDIGSRETTLLAAGFVFPF